MITVLTGGCFDLIHYGHIVFLTKAKKLGDRLVVALESDENVRKYKGSDRPIHTQKQRSAMLKSLRMVDEVIELPPMEGDGDYFNLVNEIKPDIIAITADDPQRENKKRQVELAGGKLIVVTPRLEQHSTTRIEKVLEI